MQPRRPLERIDKLRQFLDHDKHVLRFFCFWDDTENLYGDTRDFVLHYFLCRLFTSLSLLTSPPLTRCLMRPIFLSTADDTIEIREMIPENAGRDAVPCFLRRQKLPKGVLPMPLPGAIADQTVLNTIGTSQKSGGYLYDSLKVSCFIFRFLLCHHLPSSYSNIVKFVDWGH